MKLVSGMPHRNRHWNNPIQVFVKKDKEQYPNKTRGLTDLSDQA